MERPKSASIGLEYSRVELVCRAAICRDAAYLADVVSDVTEESISSPNDLEFENNEKRTAIQTVYSSISHKLVPYSSIRRPDICSCRARVRRRGEDDG